MCSCIQQYPLKVYHTFLYLSQSTLPSRRATIEQIIYFFQSTLPSLGATIEQILYNLPPGVTLTPVAFVCTQHAPAYTKLQEIINIPYHQYKIYTPRYPIRDIAAYPCHNLTLFQSAPPRGERQIRRNLTLRLLRHFQPDADDHVSC